MANNTKKKNEGKLSMIKTADLYPWSRDDFDRRDRGYGYLKTTAQLSYSKQKAAHSLIISDEELTDDWGFYA